MPEPAIPALDRAIIADVEDLLADAQVGARGSDLLVLEDESGALTRWALERVSRGAEEEAGARVLVRCRSRARSVALAADFADERGRGVLAIAGIDSSPLDLEGSLEAHQLRPTLAVGRMPKALNALDDLARAIARHAGTHGFGTRLILGGNSKHMTRTMNARLEDSFASVAALRGRGKFRCLSALDPRQVVEPHAGIRADAGLLGLGGVFSGGRPDRGGEALAAAALSMVRDGAGAAPEHADHGLRVLDLGCGNGSVSLALLGDATGVAASGGTAPAGRIAEIVATDVDMDAVRSARAALAGPAEAQGMRCEVTWDDAAADLPDASVDLVLLNPPFHEGTRVDATLVEPLLDAAARVLAPGGTLLFVHNSHLRYRTLLERRFATVCQHHRDQMFTVLAGQASAADRRPGHSPLLTSPCIARITPVIACDGRSAVAYADTESAHRARQGA